MKAGTTYTPGLNIPSRKTKGLIKIFTGNAGCGIPAPFYYTTDEISEGVPLKFGATQDLVSMATVSDGASVVGLAMQNTYDEANWDPQLRGYHFSNDTQQRLDGQPIGVLTGAGYAVTKNYTGSVAWGEAAYIAASGLLTNTGDAAAKLPVVFEGAGTDGEPVRIRFNFPLASRS